MLREKIKEILPSCCDIGFLNISDCSMAEQNVIKDFFAETKTIIVLAHHIKTSMEWIWYPHEAERNNNTCGADLHSKNIVNNINYYLEGEGYKNFIIPYPGKCGFRMKDFADRTSLGSIGDSYLFLHKQWGPWVHLRILLTDAHIESNENVDICTCIHCGNCVSSCPAKAIKKESFNGIACGEYQMSQKAGIKDNYYWKCEACARNCPIGNTPLSIKITSEV